jgi:hypothetical protein
VFEEAAYKNAFNLDLNAFLKWEQLGKSEKGTPRLRGALAIGKQVMGKSIAGQPSPRQLITQIASKVADNDQLAVA